MADRSQREVVELRVGDEHVVRLEGRGTAGYRWAPATVGDPGVAEVAEHRSEAPPTGAPGASADEAFVVRALAPGSTQITFAQRRPWEAGDTAPNREHVLDLRVTG